MAFVFRGCHQQSRRDRLRPDRSRHSLAFRKGAASLCVQVVVVDIAEEALEKGKAKLLKKVDKGGERHFKPHEVEGMKSHVTFTSDYDQLKDADLVVEAATEDLPLKQADLKEVEGLVAPHAILASNSSHLEPERIFEELATRAAPGALITSSQRNATPLWKLLPAKIRILRPLNS